jgi:hypothetical protein
MILTKKNRSFTFWVHSKKTHRSKNKIKLGCRDFLVSFTFWLHSKITSLSLKKNYNWHLGYFYLFHHDFLFVMNINKGQFNILTNINIIKKIKMIGARFACTSEWEPVLFRQCAQHLLAIKHYFPYYIRNIVASSSSWPSACARQSSCWVLVKFFFLLFFLYFIFYI